jgi:hypothetical protein
LTQARTIIAVIAAIVAPILLPAGATAAAGGDPERALAEAKALLAPSATAGSQGVRPRDGSPILRRLALALPRLSAARRPAARRLLARPTEPDSELGFGPEDARSPLCDANLCIHWARRAEHAPSPRDVAPPNGVPDFVDEVAAAAAESYRVENEQLGWTRAKSDGELGGRRGKGTSGELDIYLRDLGNRLFGLAVPESGRRGYSRSAFLVLDNDFRGFGGNPLALMRATLAHEYNHALQYAYDSLQDDWMFEATATWAEEKVFPEINDWLNYLAPFVRRSATPIFEPRGRLAKGYGSAIWNHWLDARLGPEVIRTAWERSPLLRPPHTSPVAYARAIAGGGSSLTAELAGFAVASAEWAGDARFPDAALLPDMRRQGRLLGNRKLRLRASGYRLWDVSTRSGSVRLQARLRRPGPRVAIALVGRRGPRGSGEVTVSSKLLSGRRRGSVRLDRVRSFDRVTAVAANADMRLGRRGLKHRRVKLGVRLGSRG